MRPIRITSKRQATLPLEVCDELGVGPGDDLVLEKRTVEDETVRIIRAGRPDWSWVGSLRRFGAGKSHDWSEIRDSIARARASEKRR